MALVHRGWATPRWGLLQWECVLPSEVKWTRGSLAAGIAERTCDAVVRAATDRL